MNRLPIWLWIAGRVTFHSPNDTKEFKAPILAYLALAAALALAVRPAQADNILVNTNFGENSGNKVATGWTYFDDPTVPASTHNYWIGGTNTGGFFATPLSGTQYWKEYGAGYFPSLNNVAGIYQEFGSSPGSVYQASGWFYTSSSDELGNPNFNSHVWVDVSFLDVHSNLLALYTSGDFSANVGLDQWFQFQVTNACDLSSPVATGDPYFTNYAVAEAVTNLVAPTGTTTVRYRFAYLQYENEGGSCYFDDPALNLSVGVYPPVISNIFPQNMIFVPPGNGFSFDVSSPSGSTIDNSAIHLVLNGVDVSSNLAFGGSSSNKTVSYQGLQSNTIYNASITAMDALDLSASATTYFETTWVGIPPILYLWEAEDFDFTNGMFIDDPDLCNAPGDTNCYYGTVGTPGVDEQNLDTSVSHFYRPLDEMNINVSGDYLRENLFLADRTDYEINPFDPGDWVNYTRDFTNGTYWMIARVATGINGTLSVVNIDSPNTPLGSFTLTNGLGWTTFENVFLLDTNGNKVNLTLNGTTTLQVQSVAGNLLPNFFALVVATPDEPILSGMYPTGAQPFEYTNTLSFTVTTLGATFPANGIQVNLDGINVSSNLVITGPSSNETVVYPTLLLNAIHTAIISATNSLGHGFLITNQFDTFFPNNYMVQASDFDYNGGQYIPIVVTNYNYPDWYPNAYANFEATTNIDYQHTTIAGDQSLYVYRPDGIPQEQGHDYLTTNFVNSGGVEWDLADFGPGDWANYTGDYPTGNFYVYMRTAGLGPFSMYLEQVVSGAGTTNQAIKKLGDWNAVGVNNTTYAWVPLTEDGTGPPIPVSLGGVETLRLTTTTGDCYPNYFMLVPTSGISPSIAKLGANVVVSFPGEAGVTYGVYSRSNLSTGSWNLLTNVVASPIDGVAAVSIALTNTAEFYKVGPP
ncbi:MAG TPA: carbohydrate-binding protein [Candidatus Baltobacteraceae bacterium]|nr:carbohydrate-binding protein [Candidatus Baltobacteraceae bacterium]